ncbi:MAG: hypothetical protein LBS76_04525 [Mycoplasmataceae bacterium]|jgi:copper homeostasis protein|nr:hypothetical protein [Mycoplasmataceae bacterium]
MELIKEACVETKEQIDNALLHNANQIELCSRLDLGGLTPTNDLINYALSKTDHILMMVRIEDNYSIDQKGISTLEGIIKKYVNTNIQGFVFGFLTKDNTVDAFAIKSLVKAAQSKETVFHMAFDLIEDSKGAIDELVSLGITRILTKGGGGLAVNNLTKLKELKDYASGRIQLIVGGSVTDDNCEQIAKATGIKRFHGRKLAYK